LFTTPPLDAWNEASAGAHHLSAETADMLVLAVGVEDAPARQRDALGFGCA
jgi:hypothetical protein